MKENKMMLSDEEMNNVAGGITMTCELRHGDKGDYVQVSYKIAKGSIGAGKYTYEETNMAVGVGKFDAYVQRMKERHGEVILVGTDGKPFALPS